MKRREFLGTAAVLLPITGCQAEPNRRDVAEKQTQSEEGVRIEKYASPMMN